MPDKEKKKKVNPDKGNESKSVKTQKRRKCMWKNGVALFF